MPDLPAPDLLWLGAVIMVAGLVRGFSGFGTALIFVPLASRILPPPDAILIVTITGFASAAALLPRAWRDGERPDVARLGLAAAVMVPVGVWALRSLDPIVVRWAVTLAAAVTVTAMLAGWRYHGRVTGVGLLAIGAAAGLLGGMTGLTGPAVILFYLASPRPAQVIRANIILFLAILDVFVAASLFGSGLVARPTLLLALALMAPYTLAVLAGQRLFDPARETLYRRIALAVIALAVVTGAPLWG